MVRFLGLISAVHRQWKKRRGRGEEIIPWDVQMEILSRLPAKSLMRFKCVSKLWSCLIRSRYFSNLCLASSSPLRQPRLYISLTEHIECDSMEVCHKPGKSLLLSSSSSSSSSSCVVEVQDLTMQGINGGYDMAGFRGLILYTVCTRACIYNPATRQSVTLPPVKSNLFAREEEEASYRRVSYFLGHDPVLDQYKVVCNFATHSKHSENVASEHWVCVLEAGGGWWRKVEFDQPNYPTRRGLCNDGVIYYLAATSTSLDVVFSFDVRSEEFNMIIQAPTLGVRVGYFEYCGKPTIVDHTLLPGSGLVDLYVLEHVEEDDGGGRIWSKKSLVLQPSQMHLVVDDNNNNNTILMMDSSTQNGEEIILVPKPGSTPYYLLYYDLQKNDLRKVHVDGVRSHHLSDMAYIYVEHMNKSENIIHLET